MDDQKSNRTLKGFFIRPGAQFKIFFLAAGLGQLILTLTFVAYLYFIEFLVTSSVELSGSDLGSTGFVESLFWMRIIVIVMTFIILLVSFLIFSLMTHRIFGPMVPLLRLIGLLKEGQYGETRSLRKRDELKLLMEELNDLSLTLKKRHSGGGDLQN